MNRLATSIAAIAAILWLHVDALNAHAGHVVLIPQSAVTTYTPTSTASDSMGSYFLLQFQPPAALSGEELDAAILEFYVDADSYERFDELYPDDVSEKPDAYVSDTPMIEVFAPKSTFTGDVGADKLDLESRTAIPVLLGEDRRVVIDITHIIQPVLDGTSTNFGLVIGSITGLREGNFSLISGTLGAGAVARIRFYLSPGD